MRYAIFYLKNRVCLTSILFTQDEEDSGKNDGVKADDDTDDDDENDENEDDGDDVCNHGQQEMEQLERLVPDSPLVQLEKYFRNAKR
jgi:hypothetical protein